MLISIGKKFYKINHLSYNLDGFNLNNKWISFNDNVLIQLSDDFFDLSLLVRRIKKQRLKYLISFELTNDIEQLMYIEYNYGNKGLSEIKIFMHYNLISNFSEEDIIVFIFHEIGHLMDINHSSSNKNKLKIINLLSLIIIVGSAIYLKNIIIILISFILYWLFIKYIQANMLRRQEYYADSYAVGISGHVNNVINALVKLNTYTGNIDSHIFSSHPSLKQRINYLKIRYFWHYIFK
jgi:hypothetical protein